MAREAACWACAMCGRRYHKQDAVLVDLWRQYRSDAQCSGMAAVEQASIGGGPGKAGRRPGSPLIEGIDVPKWFDDMLRKDRADWWEWLDE